MILLIDRVEFQYFFSRPVRLLRAHPDQITGLADLTGDRLHLAAQRLMIALPFCHEYVDLLQTGGNPGDVLLLILDLFAQLVRDLSELLTAAGQIVRSHGLQFQVLSQLADLAEQMLTFGKLFVVRLLQTGFLKGHLA